MSYCKMGLYNEIFAGVRRSWDFFMPQNAVHAQMGRIDKVLKLNLPPLMGRRDAAYDCVCKLIQSNLFDGSDEDRKLSYLRMQYLLQEAKDDTSSLIRTLASPDTEQREGSFLSLLNTMLSTVKILEGAADIENQINDPSERTQGDFSSLWSAAESSRAGRQLNDTELNLINYLRDTIERSGKRIAGYRAYTGKSFSKSNAERYQKAYRAYLQCYRKTPEFLTKITER